MHVEALSRCVAYKWTGEESLKLTDCINIHCICPGEASAASEPASQTGNPTTLFYKS